MTSPFKTGISVTGLELLCYRSYAKLPLTTRVFGLKDEWPDAMEMLAWRVVGGELAGSGERCFDIALSSLRFVDVTEEMK